MFRKILIIYLFLLIVNFAVYSSPLKSKESLVYRLTIKGPIVPIYYDYLKDGIEAAINNNAECVLIIIDTPGGLLETTREIIQLFLNSRIPIITYISPSGSHAASAGVFIVYASDIAAMAKATNIGSASPVNLGSTEMSETMKNKISNDIIALLQTVARQNNRNDSIVIDFIEKSVNLDEQKAKELNVINYIVENTEELLKKLNNQKISKNSIDYVLNTEAAKVIDYKMSISKKILFLISNPNITYILMILGIWALIYEFSSPGFGFAGATGVVCLVIAFFGFQALPIKAAGAILLIVGLIFLILEFFLATAGIVGIIGLISFILGSFMLIDDVMFKISLPIIIATAVFTFLYMVFVIGAILKARHSKPVIGSEYLKDEIAVVRKKLEPEGLVFVEGELWTARAVNEETIEENEKVKICEVKGLKLIVKKI
ncbi:MAG TPA: nodulation protein NfeD [bacterium]|nr:nodulation protein NfeD [bacterium]